MKKRLQKAKDFIGWVSEDGLLEVIELEGRDNKSRALFRVTCKVCSKDKELFPKGYFISYKSHLINGKKPCGCGRHPRWEPEQYMTIASRVGEGRFIVHGFAEEFHGHHTKLDLECIKDGFKWSASINSIINTGSGCSVCSNCYKPTEQEVLEKCETICKEFNYKVVGFPEGYKNKDSSFEYICPEHGVQKVSYNNFVNGGRRCGKCWKELQKEILKQNGNGNGYYAERKDEQDFLYVLDFNGEFIKVGRSFDIDERIKGLRTLSKVPKKNIYKLRIFTATHQDIHDYEQELHNELRERNFQHYVDWSTECFENDCQFVLNKLLDQCSLEEVYYEQRCRNL